MRPSPTALSATALVLALLSLQAAWGQDPICSLPADIGPCDGLCPRWFHDAETGRCEEFVWGCCGGNENNFETKAECEAACPPAICSLPADIGPCDGLCPRWFHDAETGRCEEFVWGCCGGNANNFGTKAECEAACPPDVCSLPADVGPCDGLCPSWFHDAETGRCEEFVWGCCGGNANNFGTKAECEAACPQDCPPPGDPTHLLVAKDGIDLVLTWNDAVDALWWNVFRDVSRDPSAWGAPLAASVGDGDLLLEGIQYRDAGALLLDPLFYYLVSAGNGCGESPQH